MEDMSMDVSEVAAAMEAIVDDDGIAIVVVEPEPIIILPVVYMCVLVDWGSSEEVVNGTVSTITAAGKRRVLYIDC